MKVLFLGDTHSNSGPSNVNRELVANWPAEDEVISVFDRNRFAEIARGIVLGLSCDLVVSTEGAWPDIVIHAVLAIFRKPVVCFLHGYLPFENEVDGLGCSDFKVNAYNWHLKNADALIANSKYHLDFVIKCLGGYSGERTFVHPGIPKFPAPVSHDVPNQHLIAVSGGTRPIKGNVAVAKAVKALREEGFQCGLVVFGNLSSPDSDLITIGNEIGAKFVGQLPNDIFLETLKCISLLVMNSLHDSFGISALDAVSSGASVLLSKDCGVREVFDLRECDLIENQDDIDQIKSKILYLIQHPNASRLYRSIDFSGYDWRVSSERLRRVCARFVMSGDSRIEK